MGKYTNKIERLKRELAAIYDPQTAFGNPEIAKIQAQLAAVEAEMNGKEECDECDGWGMTKCIECGHDRDCEECDATGLVEKLQPVS